MRIWITGLLVVALLGLAGCGGRDSKFIEYDGPAVTQLYVNKSARKLYLLNDKDVLREYDVNLGVSPEGHKVQYGDGRTPEGYYTIDRRNPNSAYHLSIGISYPNAADVQVARQLGVDPGGNIFIHGSSRAKLEGPADWTAGCIAVSDYEMEEIYAMVPNGTPIYITP